MTGTALVFKNGALVYISSVRPLSSAAPVSQSMVLELKVGSPSPLSLMVIRLVFELPGLKWREAPLAHYVRVNINSRTASFGAWLS